MAKPSPQADSLAERTGEAATGVPGDGGGAVCDVCKGVESPVSSPSFSSVTCSVVEWLTEHPNWKQKKPKILKIAATAFPPLPFLKGELFLFNSRCLTPEISSNIQTSKFRW